MKYVIVTGADGGMGRATVKYLKNRGYFVFALDKREISEESGVMPITVDVTSEQSVRSAFEKVKSVTESVYAVIHFAGIYMLDSLVETSGADFEKIFAINVFGAFYVNKIFMPLMKNGSKIVMVTSELAAIDPLPFTGIYAVTKSALDRYAFSLRMELQLKEIAVSVIRAGAVKTNMLGASTAALDRFSAETELYKYNAERFKKIVNGVESRCVPPEKIAEKAVAVIEKKNPRFAYSVNNNFLLKLYGILPSRLKFRVVKNILK